MTTWKKVDGKWYDISGPAVTVIENPKYAGGYRMGNVLFMLLKKPSAWHRFWVRMTLGWKWEDEK